MVGGQNSRSIFSFWGVDPSGQNELHHPSLLYKIWDSSNIFVLANNPLETDFPPEPLWCFRGKLRRMGTKTWPTEMKICRTAWWVKSYNRQHLFLYMGVNNNNTQHFLDFLANANDIKRTLFGNSHTSFKGWNWGQTEENLQGSPFFLEKRQDNYLEFFWPPDDKRQTLSLWWCETKRLDTAKKIFETRSSSVEIN